MALLSVSLCHFILFYFIFIVMVHYFVFTLQCRLNDRSREKLETWKLGGQV